MYVSELKINITYLEVRLSITKFDIINNIYVPIFHNCLEYCDSYLKTHDKNKNEEGTQVKGR